MSDYTPSGSNLKPLNPGTTKLIRYRCEGDVRSRILRWTGLPIGGTSAVAFFVTILVWIPQQVKDTNLAVFSRDLLRTYVQDIVAGNTDLQSQLDSIVRSTVTKRAGKEITTQIEKLSKAGVGKTLVSQVKDAVSRDFGQILQTPAMEAQISTAVTAALQSDEYGLLRAAVRTDLESIAQRVSEKIAENAQRIIKRVNSPLPKNQIIDKSNYDNLNRILNEIRSKPLPVGDFALRFYIAAESGQDHHYDSWVIQDYLRKLGEALKQKFRYVLILDFRSRYVALSEIMQFEQTVRNNSYRLEELLNSKSLSTKEAKHRIAELLGSNSIAYVDESSKIGEALKSEAMQSRDGQNSILDRPVAVVQNGDSNMKFQGVTSRRSLIEALLP